MKKIERNMLDVIITVILGLIALGIVILQLATVNPKTTKLELALLNVLQFIFSVGFSLYLARITFKNEFIKNQKRFAIAAYRRITDLDKSVSNLIDKIYEKMKLSPNDEKNDYEVLLVITDGIKQNIGSSIADWGDIIGDEIETLEEINKLIKERERILSTSDKSNITGENGNLDKIIERIDEYNVKLSELMSSLPETIKIQVKERQKDADAKNLDTEINKIINILNEINEKNGHILLSGFWSGGERYQIERDINDFKVGDKVKVKLTKKGDQRGPVNLVDNEGRNIGRITNNLGNSYDAFYYALEKYFQSVVLDAELIEINNKNVDSQRVSFKVKVLK